jgi:hypothetical protein
MALTGMAYTTEDVDQAQQPSGQNRIVLDWDGTLVESVWPRRDGEWLPNAVWAIKEFNKMGLEVVVNSTRLARYEVDEKTPYAEHEHEIHAIRDKLDSAGLHYVRLWLHDWKPGALFYVDDKSVPPFDGGWQKVVEYVSDQLESKENSVGNWPPPYLYHRDPGDETIPLEDIAVVYSDGTPVPRSPSIPIREFDTGATRNRDEEQLDYEGFLSPAALKRFAEYMHGHRRQADGTIRASDNWQRGIPIESYAKSLIRHVWDAWLEHRGHSSREGLEDALCGIIFNAQGWLHELVKVRNR